MKKFIPSIEVNLAQELWYDLYDDAVFFHIFSLKLRRSTRLGANGIQLIFLGVAIVITSPWLQNYLDTKLAPPLQ